MSVLVPLARGLQMIADDADAALVSAYHWCPRGKSPWVYACRWSGKRAVYFHREIAGAAPGIAVDHINGNTLDNRRGNLRIATPQENARNRKSGRGSASKFKGVSRASGYRTRPWAARIATGGVNTNLGCFATETEAARAYDTAAKQFFGPFARLNFPDDQNNVPPQGCEASNEERFLCRNTFAKNRSVGAKC